MKTLVNGDLNYTMTVNTHPTEDGSHYSIIINDKLYVLGGRSGSAGSTNQDESFSDVFYFDFIEKEFVNIGKLNPSLTLSIHSFQLRK